MASCSSSSSSSLALDFDVHLAASAGIESLHSLVNLFSHPSNASSQHQQLALDTISHFQHVISLLSRPGHARVRRFPTPQICPPPCPPHLSQELFASRASLATTSSSACSDGFDDDDGASFVSLQKSKRSSSIDLNQLDDHALISDNNPFMNDNNRSSICGSYPSIDLNKQAPSLDCSPSLSPSQQLLSQQKGASVASSQVTLSEGSNLPNDSPELLTNGCFRPPLFRPQAIVGTPLSKQGLTGNDGASLVFNDGGLTDKKSLNQGLVGYGGLALIGNEGELTGQLAQALSHNQHTNFGFEKEILAQLEKANVISTMSAASTATNSRISCISLEGSVPTTNCSMPPSISLKRKCSSKSDDTGLKCASSPSKCHCAKRRKSKNKLVKIVPAISDKVADIPVDDHSWRKYGQKPIKGSPYPRGYYKCSGFKGCPAKKHVERAPDDPKMLIVTYDGEHIHSRLFSEDSLQA